MKTEELYAPFNYFWCFLILEHSCPCVIVQSQIFHSRSRDTSNVKMVRYADSWVHKVLMMRKYLAKKHANVVQNGS